MVAMIKSFLQTLLLVTAFGIAVAVTAGIIFAEFHFIIKYW
jgi:hypothetical protein